MSFQRCPRGQRHGGRAAALLRPWPQGVVTPPEVFNEGWKRSNPLDFTYQAATVRQSNESQAQVHRVLPGLIRVAPGAWLAIGAGGVRPTEGPLALAEVELIVGSPRFRIDQVVFKLLSLCLASS